MAELEIKPSAAARMRVLGVVGAAAAIGALLTFLLTGGGRDLFERKTTLVSYMPDVTGLSIPADVRLSGIPIGYVSKIGFSGSLEPQRVVRVEMRVNTKYLKNIPRDSETSVTADTAIGSEFVSIAGGKSPIPVPEAGTLRSEPLKPADQGADAVLTFRKELQQADDLLVQISSGQTAVGQFVMGEDLYGNLLRQVSSFDNAVHTFVGPTSQVGQALFSDAPYKNIRTSLLNIDQMLSSIQKGEGVGGRLFASDEQYNTILAELRDLRKTLASGNGPLLNDDAASQSIHRMLTETDSMIAALNAGNGEIGQLLKNPQLYESLNGSLRGMQDFLKDLREHPQKYLRYKVF